MTNLQIRYKIQANYSGLLEGFENCIGEVEFFGRNGNYQIIPKGAKGFADDVLTTTRMQTIGEVALFLQGALWHYNHPHDLKVKVKSCN